MTDPLTDPFTYLLATNLGWAERILESHQADSHGDCTVCSTQQSWTKWPCVMVHHATEARKLRGNRPRNAA